MQRGVASKNVLCYNGYKKPRDIAQEEREMENQEMLEMGTEEDRFWHEYSEWSEEVDRNAHYFQEVE